MTKGNGQIVDEGLTALKQCFEGAKYLEADAKRAAELMLIGKHRELEISDATAMQMYAMVTEGKCFDMTRTNSEGIGYQVQIESYTNLADLFAGELEAAEVQVDG